MENNYNTERRNDVTEDYKYILKDISDFIGVPVGAFWICGDHPCGEDVIFGNNNEWHGYVSDLENECYNDYSESPLTKDMVDYLSKQSIEPVERGSFKSDIMDF